MRIEQLLACLVSLVLKRQGRWLRSHMRSPCQWEILFPNDVLTQRVAAEREFANGRADQPAWSHARRGRSGMEKQTVAPTGLEPAPAQAVTTFSMPESASASSWGPTLTARALIASLPDLLKLN